jgi:hypothetical protein
MCVCVCVLPESVCVCERCELVRMNDVAVRLLPPFSLKQNRQQFEINMMTSLLLAAFLTARPAFSFVSRSAPSRATTKRWLAAFTEIPIEIHVSRLSTLQTLLSKHGAPGSKECLAPNDLVAVETEPELIASMSGPGELANLHPYLYPIAKSTSSGNYICAYRDPFVELEQKNKPWPIVEAKLGGPGYQVLALNSEQLMRRIAAECDSEEKDQSIISLYNDGLGKGLLRDPALDTLYEPGSVAKLGYGTDKYVLLRVGPFPDLYANMAKQHAAKGDEQSSLIAAEASSTKISGFGSQFLFYARLLNSFPKRQEEARDAARMCLRVPLPTMGMTYEDFKEMAVIGQLADESDSIDVAVEKIRAMYEKMKEVEKEDDPNQGKTPEQAAIDKVNHIIDIAALERKSWKDIRPDIADRFRSAGCNDMADFVANSLS